MSTSPRNKQGGRNSMENLKSKPQYAALEKYVKEFQNQPDFTPQTLAHLQDLNDDFLNAAKDDESSEILSLLSTTMKILYSQEATQVFSEIIDENEGLKQQITELKAENSRLSNNSSFSPIKDGGDAKYSSVLADCKTKILQQKAEIIDLKNELQNSMSQIQNLTNEKARMEDFIRKSKEKKQKLEDLLYDTDQKVQELTKQLDESGSIEEKDQQIEDISLENEHLKMQNDNLLNFIDTQSEQLQLQNEQIAKLYEQKKKLSEFTYNLLSMLEFQQENQEEPEVMTREVEIPTETAPDFTNIFESILKTENNPEIEQIIKDESIPADARILKVIEKVKPTQEQKDLQELNEYNKQLRDAVLSTYNYINQLSRSKELQRLMVVPQPNDALKNNLISSVTEINDFIKQNNINTETEQSIFEHFLPISSDVTDIENKLIDFLLNKKLKTEENEELFLVLVQCVVANTVLRRYSMEAKNIAEKANQETRELRQELNNRSSVSEDEVKELKQKIKELEENREKTRKATQKFVAQSIGSEHEKQAKEMYNSICGASKKEIPPETLNSALLEKKCQDQKQKFLEASNKYNDMVTELQTLLQATQKEFEESKAKMKQQSDEVKLTIVEQQERIEDLEKENDQLKKEINRKSKDIEKLNRSNKSQIDEMNSQIQDVKTDMHDLVNEVREGLQFLSNESDELFNESKNVFKMYIKDLRASHTAVIQSFIDERDEKEKELNKLQKDFEQLKTTNESLKEERDKLKEDLKLEKSKSSQYSIKQRSAELKLKSIEEANARESNLRKKQNDFQIAQIKSEADNQVEHAKSEASRTMHEFCAKITRMFKEHADITQPISKENTEKTLQKVQQVLSELKNESKNKELLEDTVNQIKQTLGNKVNPQKPLSIVLADFVRQTDQKIKELESTVKEYDKIKHEYDEMSATVESQKQAKEWIDWSSKLARLVSDEEIDASKEGPRIRSIVEDLINVSQDASQSVKTITFLRDQKKINKMLSNSKVKPKLNLLAVIEAVAAVNTLKRLSGHYSNSNFAFSIDISSEVAPESEPAESSETEEYPPRPSLFGQFII